jgi:hypothetical protein
MDRVDGFFAIAALAFVCAACDQSGDTTGESPQAGGGPEITTNQFKETRPRISGAEVIHEEPLSPTSAYQWLEGKPGSVVLGRYGHADKDGPATNTRAVDPGALPSDQFRSLFPGKQVPDSLSRADGRVKEFKAKEAEAKSTLPAVGELPVSAKSTSTGETAPLAERKEAKQITRKIFTRPADANWDWAADAYWFANQISGTGGDYGACNGYNSSHCDTNNETGTKINYENWTQCNAIGPIRYTGMAAGFDTTAKYSIWYRNSSYCWFIWGTCWSWSKEFELTLSPRYYYQHYFPDARNTSMEVVGVGPGYRIHGGWEHLTDYSCPGDGQPGG